MNASDGNAAEEFVERQLDADVEITEFCIFGADFVESHFVNDAFHVGTVVGEQGDTPFVFVQAGGTGDQLADFSRPSATADGMACHETAAFVEIERIPIVAIVPAFRHRVETHDGPVRHVWVEAILIIFILVLLERRHFGFEFW